METRATDSLPLRRLRHCPSCGYALEGLPLHGNCPECGASYDQSLFVFHGYGRGKHAHFGTAKPRVAFAWASLFAILLLMAAAAFWRNRQSQWDSVGMAILVILPYLVMLLQRYGHSFPGPTQVWLTPEGCGQKHDLSTDRFLTRLLQNAGLPLVFLIIVGNEVQRKGWQEARVTAAIMLISFGVAMFALHRQRGRWRTSSNPAGPLLARWSDIVQVIVERVHGDRHRIKITAEKDGSSWTQVDAEVECSEPEATDVRRQTEQWLKTRTSREVEED